MRDLHIYCDGGFGNRFNGLISGLLLAHAAGFNPQIVWPCNNWCGAKFSDIFENTEFPVIERELATYVPEKDKFYFFMTEDHLGMGVPNQSPLALTSLPDAVNYLRADTRPVYYHSPLIPPYLDLGAVCSQISALRFQASILERAQSFLTENQLLPIFFGLQIRKTDFGANGADDRALWDLVQKAADKRFFVCSDNAEVEARFKELPNVAVFEKKAYVEKLVEGDWNTPASDHSGRVYACNVNRSAQSVLDAVVDLLILSHSQVVKTSNSTFLQTALLLKTAREQAPSNPLAPQSEHAAVSHSPAPSGPSLPQQRVVETFCQWHLGDNLIHLNFLRKLSRAYPDITFRHALQPQYISQCQELIEDLPAISLVPLQEARFSHPLDAWKGAGNFFFEHPRKFEFGHLYLDFFQHLTVQMGLRSPLESKDDLLFDYPALKKRVLQRDYDFLVVNSVPLSGQFKDYSEEGFVRILQKITDAGFSLITTKKVDRFDCTLDSNLSVTGIGNVSLYSHFLLAVCTGSMWPSINVFNNFRHTRKIILNDHETVDFGENIHMARTMDQAEEEIDRTCAKYQPLVHKSKTIKFQQNN